MDVIISLWSKTIPLMATMTSMVTKNKVISSIMKSAIEKKFKFVIFMKIKYYLCFTNRISQLQMIKNKKKMEKKDRK